MSYEISITPAAISDISVGVDYNNTKAKDLGYKFADDLENNFRIISLNPAAFSIRYKNVRGKLLKKFPYLILYTENKKSKSIKVLRIFNTYQNQFWKVRKNF